MWHLKPIGKVKKLDKWVPHDLTKNLKKNVILKYHLLILGDNNEPFPYWIVIHDKKWVFYNQWQPAQWLDEEEAWKHFPKPNFHQKKGSWSMFGGLLPLWSSTDFWIPEKPLHLRSMLSKSTRYTENCSAYSQHWSTGRAQFSKTTPDCMSHNWCFKSWRNWATKFCLICYIHLTSCQPTTTFSRILTTFAAKMLPQLAGLRQCFPRVCQIMKHGFLCYRNKQAFFFHWQKSVDCNGSYFD